LGKHSLLNCQQVQKLKELMLKQLQIVSLYSI
jgi:hypothetical protein